jgi:acetoacetate decarboxylase
MIHSRYMPRIEGDGTDSYSELVTMSGRDVELGQAWRGDAEIELLPSPVEEIARLEVRESHRRLLPPGGHHVRRWHHPPGRSTPS